MTRDKKKTMSNATTISKGQESIRGTIERYSRQRPQIEGILKAFQPLLEERVRLIENFIETPVDLGHIDRSRLDLGNPGLPLLAGGSLDFLASWIEQSAKAILPALRKALPDSKGMEDIAQALDEKRLGLMQCCTLFMDKDNFSLEKAAKDAEVNPGMLHFAIEQILSAPVGAVARLLRANNQEMTWKQGYCPVCGSFPSVACLSRPEPTDLDNLVGGGGQKILHCSLCGNDWRFRRDACPACDNADPGSREILSVEKAKFERVDACTKCKAYFPCVDLREYADLPDLSVAPLALMHLDIIAAQKGYAPLATAPWNTFQK